MENGLSAPSTASMESIEERVRRIPLPNELPQGLDFAGIPAHALKSSTIESLISQNEDLMARLSVTLRKVNELETTAGRAERDVGLLRQRFEALKEQYMVLREKDRIASTRGADLQRQNVAARERGEKLERQFASVFTQGQAFQRRLRHLERYRARIRRAARGVRREARSAAQLTQDLAAARADNQRLAEAYEGRLVEAMAQVKLLVQKAGERDKVFAENVRLGNDLVRERRQAAVQRGDQQATIDRLAADVQALRQTEPELARLREALPELIASRDALADQVDSLQNLWAAKQREIDAADEKLRNLQKLNQSLSVTLNEQRREMANQTALAEQQRFNADEQLKILRTEIGLLRRAQTND